MKANLKNEDHVPMARIVVANFRDDIADFTTVYTDMDGEYLRRFEKSLADLNDKEGRLSQIIAQKELTVSLYNSATELGHLATQLSSYLKRANLQYREASFASTRLKRRDIEAGTANIHELLKFADRKRSELETKGGMPPNFLTELADNNEKVHHLNEQQNLMLAKRRKYTEDNQRYYNDLYAFIAEVCAAAKIVYRLDPNKRRQYSITALKSLLKTSRAAAAE